MLFLNVLILIISLIVACSLPAGAQGVDYAPYEIIVSEIMADPTPVVKLPDAEYIELYNRGSSNLNLLNWTLTVGSRKATIPEAVIKPGEYKILCDDPAAALFNAGTATPVNLPPVRNTGQVITLRSPSGDVIHSVEFSADWYHNKEKDDGGWSLEIIDTGNPCGGEDNWKASEDPSGGTPGYKNSVSGVNRDNKHPELLKATLPSESALLLHFSEPLNPFTINSPGLYSVNNGMYHPAEVYPVEPGFTQVLLKYHSMFNPDHIYTVTVLNELYDCAGNVLAPNALAEFAIPGPPATSDIVINEIMFEAGEKEEFVEIYNRSDKVLGIDGLAISLADRSSGTIIRTVKLEETPFILLPHAYCVLSRKGAKLAKDYDMKSLKTVLELKSMFTLPDTEGLIVLADTTGNTIDECYYSKSRHHDLLNSTRGVSIERKNPDLPSVDPGNWHSASALSGFATPGLRNSQNTAGTDNWNVTLSCEVLSPDGDGIDDEVKLHIRSDEPGRLGTITVYDLNGRLIKTLISNTLTGTDEYIIWDGRNRNGLIVEPGLYLIYGEMYNLSGEVKGFRKVIPVVRK